MPISSALLRASSAFSSSLYIRKRLPEPNTRIDTFAPVLPSVRVGIFSAPTARPVTAALAMKPRLEMLIGSPRSHDSAGGVGVTWGRIQVCLQPVAGRDHA